ncbi:hypothetical protein GCM10009801_22610 [Streptomyces albiaxialis]|uniref:Uncharacterized protein n=1 Tax=Streptomyces albiaxialis TaxID=329523 RepID=A0ABN2VTK0_9ACTN
MHEVAVGPLHHVVAVGDAEADVDGGEAVLEVGLGAVLEVDRGDDEEQDLQQRLAEQHGRAGARHPCDVAQREPRGEEHPEAHLADDDQRDDHGDAPFRYVRRGT